VTSKKKPAGMSGAEEKLAKAIAADIKAGVDAITRTAHEHLLMDWDPSKSPEQNADAAWNAALIEQQDNPIAKAIRRCPGRMKKLGGTKL
jgi:hypothetical protein